MIVSHFTPLSPAEVHVVAQVAAMPTLVVTVASEMQTYRWTRWTCYRVCGRKAYGVERQTCGIASTHDFTDSFFLRFFLLWRDRGSTCRGSKGAWSRLYDQHRCGADLIYLSYMLRRCKTNMEHLLVVLDWVPDGWIERTYGWSSMAPSTLWALMS